MPTTAWQDHFGAARCEPAVFDRIFLAAFLVVFLVVEIVVLRSTTVLGDLGVESDFFAEIGPAARHLAAGRFDLADYPFKGPVSAIAVATVHLLTGPWGLDLFRTAGLISLVSAAVVLIFTYLLGLRLWGRRTAVAAVVIVTTNKLFFINAHKAGSDLLFLALAVAVLWRIVGGARSSRGFVVTGVVAGLAFLTRYVGIALPAWVLAAIVLLPAGTTRRERLRDAGWFLVGWGVVVLPWLVVNLVGSGSVLATGNLQNVVQHFYPAGAPGESFSSLGAVFTHDPLHFTARYLRGLGEYFLREREQVLGWALAVLTAGGLVALFVGRPDRRRLVLAGWGLVYLLAVAVVFYLARFSLPLVPVYALLAGSLLDRLPRWTPALALVLLGFAIWWQIDFARTAVAFYRAEQPLYLQRSFAFLNDQADRWRGDGTPRVMARKPHAAWYGGMDYVAYPGDLGGTADLLAYAAEAEADFLVAGLIEHRFLRHSEFLEHLDRYRGVEKVFQADGNIVYRLDRRQAGPAFGTRDDLEQLRRGWSRALAQNDSAQVMATGSRLIEILDADGRFAEAREVAGLKIAYAGGRDILVTRLNLAWVSLKLGDATAGISALEGHLTRDGTPERDAMIAKGRMFLGQLYHEAGDVDEALRWLRAALELYEELGRGGEAAPLRDFIGRLAEDKVDP